mgnify:CR=1 FL=1
MTVHLGRHSQCELVLEGNDISRQHALITNQNGNYILKDNGSLNGTFVNGERITEEICLLNGDVITIGKNEIYFLDGVLSSSKPMQKTGATQKQSAESSKEAELPVVKQEGYPHYFKRAPRLKKDLPADKITIDNPPNKVEKPENDKFAMFASPVVSIVTIIISAVISVAAPFMLIITLPMSILSLVMTIRNNKKQTGKAETSEQNRLKKYGEYLDGIETQIKQLKEKQLLAMQQDSPAIRTCVDIIKEKDTRLWSKRPQDQDFLWVRLGFGECPASYEVKGGKEGFVMEEDELLTRVKEIVDKSQKVQGAPILCDIFNHHLVGVIGERKSAVNLVKNMVLQTATLHSYEEVKIVTLYAQKEKEDWEWIKWLPHSFDDSRKRRFVASSGRTADFLLKELEEVFKQRAMAEKEEAAFWPYYLFVVSDESMMEEQPILKYLLQNGRNLGVGVIFLYDEMYRLPKECNIIVEASNNKGLLFHKEKTNVKQYFQMDELAPQEFDKIARTMAPIRIAGAGAENSLPSSITFLEGYGVKTPQEIDLAYNWNSSYTYQSMAVQIGVKTNGEPFYFDIHEKKHGPHGLVAGMTGSGKSEMVQSWILSMAAKFSPQDASFVLIDFKGTGLILPFMNLPHLAGTISDLDTKISRNLIALENELLRRKELLDRHGVNNINNYLKLYKAGKVEEPLSYLFIVIDEFAEFKVQFPDFMTVIDRIFAIGRTLGVFAILLTQKPAGVVDDKMNANTRFRWCLKVASSADSRDMLHHADAAKITNPGRAYVQVGEDEVYELIQSYYSGATYHPEGRNASDTYKIAAVAENGNRTYFDTEELHTGYVEETTEISEIVSYFDTYVKENQMESAKQIWMPKMPYRMYLDDVKKGYVSRPMRLAPVVGLVDDPAAQKQYPLTLDFTEDGHIAIYGAPSTGKTTFLQTAIMSMVTTYTPEDVNIYIMDFGGWSLNMFRSFPHVGGIANDNDEIRVEKLAQLIERILNERKMKFAEEGVSSVEAFYQATGEKLPYVVLVVDNFAPVLQLYPNLDSFFIRLTREAGNYGIFMLASAGNEMAINYKISQNIKMALALQMTDKADYSGIVGKTNGLEPENNEGRGLVKGVPPLEFQTALPVYGETEGERVKEIRRIGEEQAENWNGVLAAPIPIMPDRIGFGSVAGNGMTIGLSTKDILPVVWKDTKTHYLPIVGQYASGKSNMLKLITKYKMQEEDVQIAYVDFKGKQTTWQKDERITFMHEAEELDDFMEALIPTLRERKETHDEDNEAEFSPIAIFIDEYKSVFEAITDTTAKRLGSIIRLGEGLNVFLCIAAEQADFDKFCVQGETVCMLMAEANSAILLGGRMSDYTSFKSDLSFQDRSQSVGEWEGYVLEKGKAVRMKAMACEE